MYPLRVPLNASFSDIVFNSLSNSLLSSVENGTMLSCGWSIRSRRKTHEFRALIYSEMNAPDCTLTVPRQRCHGILFCVFLQRCMTGMTNNIFPICLHHKEALHHAMYKQESNKSKDDIRCQTSISSSCQVASPTGTSPTKLPCRRGGAFGVSLLFV